jgi:hypothetical protein
MKTIKILLTCIIVAVCIPYSQAQRLKPDDLKYFNFYFSLSPAQRASFLQIEAPTGNVSGFWLMSYDLASLSGIDIMKSGSVGIAGVIGAVVVDDEKLLNQLVDSMQYLVDNKSYYFIHKTEDLANVDTTDRSVLGAYLRNGVMERITFLEKYFDRISPELLGLLKKDMDRIFNVKTNAFTGDKKLFLEAKKTWLSSAKR